MTRRKIDLMQGTLDIMVLQTLTALGPLHGYGLARRIEQTSGDQILLNQGTIYASLVRLQNRGWIRARNKISCAIALPKPGMLWSWVSNPLALVFLTAISSSISPPK